MTRRVSESTASRRSKPYRSACEEYDLPEAEGAAKVADQVLLHTLSEETAEGLPPLPGLGAHDLKLVAHLRELEEADLPALEAALEPLGDQAHLLCEGSAVSGVSGRIIQTAVGCVAVKGRIADRARIAQHGVAAGHRGHLLVRLARIIGHAIVTKVHPVALLLLCLCGQLGHQANNCLALLRRDGLDLGSLSKGASRDSPLPRGDSADIFTSPM